PVPVLLTPPVLIPEKIRYCCICNLWIRGLSIYYYYYWLIIIINYVNFPLVTLGVEDALASPPCPHPTAVQETVVCGHQLDPEDPSWVWSLPSLHGDMASILGTWGPLASICLCSHS
ncbi:hypothetical protein LEMLEM_LOCUS2958, partial [Lemmus lemmus]